MTFDLKKYRDENYGRYGDASLDYVVNDIYTRFGMDRVFDSPDAFVDRFGLRDQLVPEVEQPKSVIGEFTRGLGMGKRGVESSYHGSRAMLSGDEAHRQERLGKVEALHEETGRKMISVPEFTDILRRDEDTGKIQIGETVDRATRWAAGQAGAMAPIVGSIMAGGVAGAKAGGLLGPKGAVLGSIVGSFTAGYGLYAGDMYSSAREQGAKHQESKEMALKYGVPASAVSIVVPLAATGAVLGAMGKDFVKNRAKSALLGAGLSTPAEATAEGIAESFVIAGEESLFGVTLSDEEKRDRILNAASAGGLMGFGMGAIGGAGRPSGDLDTYLDSFADSVADTYQKTGNHEILGLARKTLENSSHDFQGKAELLHFLETEEARSNKPLNKALKNVNTVSKEVFGRSYEENAARAEELSAKMEAGELAGTEALELTSILSNREILKTFKSPAGRLKDDIGGMSNEELIGRNQEIVAQLMSGELSSENQAELTKMKDIIAEEAGMRDITGELIGSSEPVAPTRTPQQTPDRTLITESDPKKLIDADGKTAKDILTEGGDLIPEATVVGPETETPRTPLTTEKAPKVTDKLAKTPREEKEPEAPIVEQETEARQGLQEDATPEMARDRFKLAQEQADFVDNKINSLGSIEKVDNFYNGKDKVNQYARERAREIYGEQEAEKAAGQTETAQEEGKELSLADKKDKYRIDIETIAKLPREKKASKEEIDKADEIARSEIPLISKLIEKGIKEGKSDTEIHRSIADQRAFEFGKTAGQPSINGLDKFIKERKAGRETNTYEEIFFGGEQTMSPEVKTPSSLKEKREPKTYEERTPAEPKSPAPELQGKDAENAKWWDALSKEERTKVIAKAKAPVPSRAPWKNISDAQKEKLLKASKPEARTPRQQLDRFRALESMTNTSGGSTAMPVIEAHKNLFTPEEHTKLVQAEKDGRFQKGDMARPVDELVQELGLTEVMRPDKKTIEPAKPEPKAPTPEPAAKQKKEPWEMTQDEFATTGIITNERKAEQHKQLVTEAVEDAAPVPSEVLAAYPELQAKAKFNEDIKNRGVADVGEATVKVQKDDDGYYVEVTQDGVREKASKSWEDIDHAKTEAYNKYNELLKAPEKKPAVEKPKAEKPDNKADEQWWDKELTPAGRRQMLEAAGIRLPDKVQWNSLSSKAKSELLEARKEKDAAISSEDSKPERPKSLTETKKEAKDAKTDSEGKTVTPGREGSGALEGASTPDVQGADGRGKTGDRSTKGSRQDKRDAGQPDGKGDAVSPGVGDGEGGVSVSSGRRRGKRGTTGKRGLQDDGGRSEGIQPDNEGTDRDGSRPEVERGQGERESVQDFKITEDIDLGAGGQKTKFKNNVAAIRLAKELIESGRKATPAEQKVLAQYVGWGGLPQAFDASNAKWTKEHAELKEILTQEEYEAAKQSTQYAHYTSKPVIDGIYSALKRLGFMGGNMLEPGSGVGNFYGLMPDTLRASSRMTMIEREALAGNIAKLLYPNQNVQIADFTRFQGENNYFDAAIGNPPFSDTTLTDKAGRKHLSGLSIHNYFFAKAVDMLREGGVLAMVTSSYFLDSSNLKSKTYIGERTEFLGAIRLPNNAFSRTANTEVTTDIIFLKKRPQADFASKAVKEEAKAWTELARIPDPLGGEDMLISQYFADNPHMMLGEMQRAGSMYGPALPALIAKPGADIAKALEKAVQSLPEGVIDLQAVRNTEAESKAVPLGDESVDVNGHYEKDGKVFVRIRDAADGTQQAKEITEKTPLTEKTKYGKKGLDKVRKLAGIRKTLRKLLDAELKEDASMDSLRKQLNKEYDQFVKKHGYVNEQKNINIFREDPDFPLLASLEHNFRKSIGIAAAKTAGIKPRPAQADKAPIFSQRVLQKHKPAKKAESPEDALSLSIAETGRINPEYMGKLLGQDGEAVLKKLSEGDNPRLFIDPAHGGYVLRDEYLSGNVRAKLRQAKAAGMYKNAEALEKVLPEDVPSYQISAKLGAPWVPDSVYNNFAAHLFGEGTKSTLQYVPATSSFIGEVAPASRTASSTVYGTKDYPGHQLLLDTLNGKEIKLGHYEKDPVTGTRRFILDKKATDEAWDKAQEIKDAFADWLFKEAEQSEMLTREYNDKVNNYVKRQYDGSWVQFVGKVPDSVIKLYKHQKDAVARIILEGKALLDHVVGAGKTYTMIASIMEMKRMGLAHKPMVTVPNHLTEQFAADVYRLYPGANVLAPTKKDFSRENRRKLMAKIATGNWDVVVIPHSQFGFIKPDPNFEIQFNGEQVEKIMGALRELGDPKDTKDQGKKRTIKQLANMKEKLEERIARLRDKPVDDLLDFQQLGVDQLYVDEAHKYKNLMYFTKMHNVRGLGQPQGSMQAYDMYVKTQQLFKQNGSERGVIFATGTPVSNSLAEMFHMMRYLIPGELNSMGMDTFDAWAKTFADVELAWMQSLAGDGSYKSTNRMTKFVNSHELLKMYNQFADTITNKHINDSYKQEFGRDFPLPKLKGGTRTSVSIERSPSQDAYMQAIAERVKEMQERGGRPEKGADNMLSIMGDARKMAMDIRLVDPTIQERDPNGRIAKAADNIFAKYQEFDHVKGTQLVFSDMGTPKKHAKKELEEYRTLSEAARVAEDESVQNMAELGDKKAIAKLAKAEEAQEKLDAKGQDWLGAVQAAMRGFSIYDDLKLALIEKGIPEKEIAFIHDYNTDKQKAALFRSVNDGEIRILLGSTEKLGAGTNVQERMVGLHHLDVPWKPSDIEQREGRIIRQGNKLMDEIGESFEIEISAYATKDTLDLFMWQTQEKKLSIIGQMREGEVGREMDNAFEQFEVSVGEMQAAATSNPYLLEEIQVKEQVKKLERQKRSFEGQKNELINKKRKVEDALETLPEEIEEARAHSKAADNFLAKQDDRLQNAVATVSGKEIKGAQQIRDALKEEVEARKKSEDGAEPTSQWPLEFNGKEYKSESGVVNAMQDLLGDRQAFDFTGISGKEHVTRKDAAKEAAEEIKKIFNAQADEVQLGSMGEFQLFVAENRTGKGRLTGLNAYVLRDGKEVGTGFDLAITRENLERETVNRTPAEIAREALGYVDRLVTNMEGKLSSLGKKLEQAKKEKEFLDQQKEVGEWPKQKELDAARKRHRELIKLLKDFSEGKALEHEQSKLQAKRAKKITPKDVETKPWWKRTRVRPDAVMYQLTAPAQPAAGVKAADLKKAVSQINEFSDNAMSSVHVVQSVGEVPIEAYAAMAEQDALGNTPALFLPESGDIYLIADNVASVDAAISVSIVHEMVHKGIENVRQGKMRRFGSVEKAANNVNMVLDEVALRYQKHINKLLENEYAGAYEELSEAARRRKMAEELLAHYPDVLKQSKWYDRYVAAVTRFIRTIAKALGRDIKVTDAEVRNVLTQAHDSVRTQRLAGGQVGVGVTPSYLMAGKKAKKAKGEQLRKAQTMKESGESRKKIWNETGWWEIVPGQWAFEIDDRGTGVPENMLTKREMTTSSGRVVETLGYQGPLRPFFIHPPLYQQYDFLGGIEVAAMIDPNIERISAEYIEGKGDRGVGTIRISAKDRRNLKAGLLHEIQHAIQEHEGFGRGGSPEAMVVESAVEVDYIREQLAQTKKDLADLETNYKSAERPAYKERLKKEINETKSRLKQLQRGLLDPTLSVHKDQHKAYQSLTGEAESRLVEKRTKMTPAQRKAEPPWQTLEVMLKKEGLLKEGQKPEDVLISRHEQSAASLSVAVDAINESQVVQQLENLYGRAATSRITHVSGKDEAQKLQKWYESAMRRKSDYVGNLERHLLNKHGVIWKPYNMESALAGQIVEDIFVISHFAPKNLREGRDLIVEAASTKTPMVAAVPEHLANQLEKSGFRKIGEIPQWFAGKYVQKTVMVNNAFTDADAKTLFDNYVANEPAASYTSVTAKDFHDLAKQQRGKPEMAMVKAQKVLGGGVMDYVIEHVGDLNHRMNEWVTFDTAGYEYVKNKVDTSLDILTQKYGFLKEHHENLKGNAEYKKISLFKHNRMVEKALKEYADAHRELPVYNEAQRLARDAAIALGEGNYKQAVSNLKSLKKHLSSKKEWVAFAREGLATETDAAPDISFQRTAAPKAKPKSVTALLDEIETMAPRRPKTAQERKKKKTTNSLGVPIDTVEGEVGLADARLKSDIKSYVTMAFDSASDRLRAAGMGDLANRIDNYFDQWDARTGRVNAEVRKVWKKVKKAGEKKVLRKFEEYYAHKENGRRAEAKRVLDSSPALRDLVSTVEGLFDMTGTENQTVKTPYGVGMKVWDDHRITSQGDHIGQVDKDGKVFKYENGKRVLVGTMKGKSKLILAPGFLANKKGDTQMKVKKGGYRLIGKIGGKGFFPRTLKEEVIKVMQNPELDTGLWNQLADSLIESGRVKSKAEARDYLRSYFSDQVRNDYFAGIEKARGEALPEIFYDYSFNTASRYFRKWAQRISQAEQFGQALGENHKDWFGRNKKKIMDRRTFEYVDSIEQRLFNVSDLDVYKKITNTLNLFATGTQLGNPATAALNLVGGSTLNIQMYGLRNVAKAWGELLTDWKKVQAEGVALGILGKDVLNILNDTDAHSHKYWGVEDAMSKGLGKFASWTMKWGGYKPTENLIRATGMLASRNWLMTNLKAKEGSKNRKKLKRWAQRHNIDYAQLVKEGGSGAETAKFLRKAVNIPQGSYRIDMVPVFTDKPFGRFLFKYQKFGTQVSRMFYQNHLQPFLEAKTPGERVQGLSDIFQFFGAAVIGGTVVASLRQALFGYGDPGPEWDEMEQHLASDDNHKAWAWMADRAWHSIMAVGALGFYGNYMQFGMDWMDQQRVKNPLDPPGLAAIDAFLEPFMRFQEQGTLTKRDMDEIVQGYFAFYRANKRVTLKAMDSMGSEFKEAQLWSAETDKRYVRKIARRFADEMEIEHARPTSGGRLMKTERSPMNQRLYEALAVGDHHAARQIYFDAIDNASPEERQRIRMSMISSMRNRQPVIVAGVPSEETRREFLNWARKNVGEESYLRILRADQRYRNAARIAGVL